MSNDGIPGFTDGDINRRRALKRLLNGEEPEEEDELDRWFRENPLPKPGPEPGPARQEKKNGV
ncbi:MAG: hypothetical protein JW738_03345 [Actinobacteria bacterium]|nr:hypothetical protein [Actinomycetota bacterium]